MALEKVLWGAPILRFWDEVPASSTSASKAAAPVDAAAPATAASDPAIAAVAPLGDATNTTNPSASCATELQQKRVRATADGAPEQLV